MKKLFGIFVVLTFILSIVITGCGGHKNIKIGVIAPLSGPLESIGKEIKNAVETAVVHINADGGVKNQMIEVYFEDSMGVPAKGIEAFNKLKKEIGVTAIVGPVSSEVTLAVAPYAEKSELPIISPVSSSPEITKKGNDWVFRVYPSDTIEAQRLANTMFTELYIRNFVPIAIKNSYGYGISNEIIKIARNTESMNIPEVIRYSPDATYERFLEIAEKVKEMGPEAVLLASYPEDGKMLIKAFNEVGVECFRFSTSSIALPHILKPMGEDALGLIYAKAPFEPKSTAENVKRFVEEFMTRYSKEPDVYAAHGYDALTIAAKAHSRSSRPDDVQRRLQQVKGYKGVSGEISIDKFGDVIKFPKIFRVRKDEAGEIFCTLLTEEDMNEIKDVILQ